MDEQQDRKAQQGPKKLGRKGKGGGMTPKENKKPELFIILGGKEYEVEKMAKGGRAGFKSGSKGCKLAMKGKGRAYGKNS